ncbi:MAG: ATP-binding protein [Flavobacteriaceae bacterium]|nr:ATP-binding protein [Flavobacteriaceae bacterium]
MKTRRIVITGGPAVGKTALIDHLESLNYHCFPELIREFTMEETENKSEEALLSNPIVFADDSMEFNQRLLNGRAQQFYSSKELNEGLIFFDRGLPDVLAYMDFFNQTYPQDFIDTCSVLKYDEVFILPPWQEIFKEDEGRFESYQEGLRLYDQLLNRYSELGYQPIVVPKDTVEHRVKFILSSLNQPLD